MKSIKSCMEILITELPTVASNKYLSTKKILINKLLTEDGLLLPSLKTSYWNNTVEFKLLLSEKGKENVWWNAWQKVRAISWVGKIDTHNKTWFYLIVKGKTTRNLILPRTIIIENFLMSNILITPWQAWRISIEKIKRT